MISAVADSVFSRWRSKKYTRDSSLESSLNSSLSESTSDPYSWFEVEVWIIDICTNQNTRILASADWMDAKMKMSRKDLEVAWNHFAKLKPYCRNRILEFLNDRRDEEPGWTLCHFEFPQKWSPARIFTARRDEQIIQLTLSRPNINDQDSDSSSVRPKIEGLGGGLPKRVAFDGGLRGESGTKGEAKTTDDNVLALDTLDLTKKIAGLEKKKHGLGPQDNERLADLNDMIAYLQDQLKSKAKTTSIHEQRPTERGKSDSSQAPGIIHEEQSLNPKRREIIIEKTPNESDQYYNDLDPLPPPRPRRMYVAEGNSITRYPPRQDSEYVVRNNSRYGPRERQDYYEEDVIVRSLDRDRPPSRHWQERSRAHSRPMRQDSFGPRGGPIVRRDKSRERPRPSDYTSQPSKQVSEEIYREYRRPIVGYDRTRSRQGTIEEDVILRRGEKEREMPREGLRERDIEFERDYHTWPRERPRERDIEYERDYYPRRPRDQIVIRRNERSPSRESEPERNLAPVRDRYEDDRLSPNSGAIVIRGDERSQYRPREKYSRQRTVDGYDDQYDERHAVEPPSESQALVLRAGASRLPHDYVRERILNGSIRVRGDDHIGNPSDDSPGFSDDRRPRRRSLSRRSVGVPEPAVSSYIRRPSRPAISRRGSYRDRSWAPSLRRRLSETWHQFDSSEDEESRYTPIKRLDSEKSGPETELSDAEVIAQTLKQLTTIQDGDMPGTGLPAPPSRTRSEVGPSALKNTSFPSSGPERQRSFPVTGRKAHFESNIGPPQPDPDAGGEATKERSNPADEETFLDRISEEPDVLTEDNDTPHHQRVTYFPERPISSPTNQRTPFPYPPELTPHTRETSPRPRSPTSTLDSPRSTSANGSIILEHQELTLASQGEEAPNHAAQEVRHEEVEVTRTISRNPTVYEETD